MPTLISVQAETIDGVTNYVVSSPCYLRPEVWARDDKGRVLRQGKHAFLFLRSWSTVCLIIHLLRVRPCLSSKHGQL